MSKENCTNCKHFELPEYVDTTDKPDKPIGGWCVSFDTWLHEVSIEGKIKCCSTRGSKK